MPFDTAAHAAAYLLADEAFATVCACYDPSETTLDGFYVSVRDSYRNMMDRAIDADDSYLELDVRVSDIAEQMFDDMCAGHERAHLAGYKA